MSFGGDLMETETIGSNGIIKKSEYIRIIIDALNSLGFHGLGTQLEVDSGIPLHSPTAKQFLKEVKDRDWDKSIATLKEFKLSDENPVKFLLLEQKFFDLLKNENYMDAVRTLRSEMVPLGVNTKRVHELATKLISSDTESVNSWSKVVKELHNLLPTGVIIPEKRLEYLLEYSLFQQRQCCAFHNVPDSDLSICSDHHCRDRKLPSVTVQTLEEHKGEVWFVKFSHNGKYLASSSTDKTAIIWEMNEGKLSRKHKLEGHKNPVVAVLWRPDDSEVITCGENEDIRRWEVATGDCIHLYRKNGVGTVSCGWFADGLGIIGGMDDRSICLWNLDGTEIVEHELGLRAHKLSDVAMTNDGKYIVSLGKEPNEISLFNRATKVRTVIQEEARITSFSLPEDDKKIILINLITQKSHIWTYEGEPKKYLEFSGHKRSRFIIRSCFGGYKGIFIASGSEDSQVYIWRWRTRRPCRVLPGHAAVVNCVSWNPIDMHMLASGSDDKTIRIWGLDQKKMK